jgi:uncharacterized membrane protein YhaH (DUF805 family)
MLNNKFWQGFFAIGPIVMFLLFFIAYFFFIFSFITQISELENSGTEILPTSLFAGMGVFFLFLILMLFVSLGSLIFYIMHAIKNPNLKQGNTLVVWILLFVFVSGLGQLIYWIIEILGKRNNTELET